MLNSDPKNSGQVNAGASTSDSQPNLRLGQVTTRDEQETVPMELSEPSASGIQQERLLGQATTVAVGDAKESTHSNA